MYNEHLKRYKKHVDAYGGLFTSITRQNLLGINPKNPQPYKDTPNFWSDVRKSVGNGLIDLQLVCAMAHTNQIKKMFQYTPLYSNEDRGGEISPEEFYALRPNLTSVISSILPSFPIFNNTEDLLWRADIAKRLVTICLEFLNRNNLIRSPVHARHLSEVKSILDAELGIYK